MQNLNSTVQLPNLENKRPILIERSPDQKNQEAKRHTEKPTAQGLSPRRRVLLSTQNNNNDQEQVGEGLQKHEEDVSDIKPRMKPKLVHPFLRPSMQTKVLSPVRAQRERSSPLKSKSPDAREKEPIKPVISPVKSTNIETPKLGSTVGAEKQLLNAEKMPKERIAHTAEINLSKSFYKDVQPVL